MFASFQSFLDGPVDLDDFYDVHGKHKLHNDLSTSMINNEDQSQSMIISSHNLQEEPFHHKKTLSQDGPIILINDGDETSNVNERSINTTNQILA